MYFDGDVTLIVVHRQHRVELAGDGSVEHGIRRQRADGVDACFLRSGHRWRDFVDLLAA